jgi:glycerol-3-phosphate dehydrogenase
MTVILRFMEDSPSIQAEVAYSVGEDMATSIEDVLARRVGLQLSEKYDIKIPKVTIWRNT